ncbi:3-oxoacyl-[acyl-carrier-protein] reductase FabG-like [Zingiber officinale]|uniref:Uncharacterized protein n=1 Tax=Zingiber officinale TaxID=94328 RepID=A0A8J5HJS6_ZINOF|nr:3-oxoacyl-[acyl-carrier-protein] reductase FabG-like [Zingiber officinale]XP_042464820.1 3-oxoacyl-[acyl-carrier-protein] reductase FabG-like [Zingiber officinale]KAG6526331.1 hypothetical protein ZIOFF_016314 [Zingiber officinale]KAG6530147.1 hypothetical protein ZIOFF_012369 [Zingiber officinale]
MEGSGKRVLLASNGDDISMGVAYHLAKSGCSLVLLGNESQLQTMAEDIMISLNEPTYVKVVGLNVDEDHEDNFDKAVGTAWKILGKLDAFVNCYSYEGKMQEYLHVTEQEFKKTVVINFMAPWFLQKAVAKLMRDQKAGGSIVFISQILGAERGLYPGAAAYGSSLAAVQQLVRLSALEVGKYNIRVNAVARGLHLDDEYPRSVGKDKAEKSTADVMPLLRWLDPKNDLASTVMYLVGDDSRYMTGTTIFVDGAQSIVRPRMRSFM